MCLVLSLYFQKNFYVRNAITKTWVNHDHNYPRPCSKYWWCSKVSLVTSLLITRLVIIVSISRTCYCTRRPRVLISLMCFSFAVKDKLVFKWFPGEITRVIQTEGRQFYSIRVSSFTLRQKQKCSLLLITRGSDSSVDPKACWNVTIRAYFNPPKPIKNTTIWKYHQSTVSLKLYL